MTALANLRGLTQTVGGTQPGKRTLEKMEKSSWGVAGIDFSVLAVDAV